MEGSSCGRNRDCNMTHTPDTKAPREFWFDIGESPEGTRTLLVRKEEYDRVVAEAERAMAISIEIESALAAERDALLELARELYRAGMKYTHDTTLSSDINAAIWSYGVLKDALDKAKTMLGDSNV